MTDQKKSSILLRKSKKLLIARLNDIIIYFITCCLNKIEFRCAIILIGPVYHRRNYFFNDLYMHVVLI